jgi:hypothetical protein
VESAWNSEPQAKIEAKSPQDACSVNPIVGIRFQSGCHAARHFRTGVESSTEYFPGRRLEARASASASIELFLTAYPRFDGSKGFAWHAEAWKGGNGIGSDAASQRAPRPIASPPPQRHAQLGLARFQALTQPNFIGASLPARLLSLGFFKRRHAGPPSTQAASITIQGPTTRYLERRIAPTSNNQYEPSLRR